jgi:hypothetical protein
MTKPSRQVLEKALGLACEEISDQADEMGFNDACTIYNIRLCRYKCNECKGVKLKSHFIKLASKGRK